MLMVTVLLLVRLSCSLVLLVFLNMMLFYKLWMLEYSAQSLTTWQGLRLHERYARTHTRAHALTWCTHAFYIYSTSLFRGAFTHSYRHACTRWLTRTLNCIHMTVGTTRQKITQFLELSTSVCRLVFPAANCLRRRWSGRNCWRRSSGTTTPSCRSGGRSSSRRWCCWIRYRRGKKPN